GLIYGRTNMDEFAMGSSNETSAYGPARNPVNRDYIPGGSSGGAAAAVAGGLGLAALGSDTGGSIRQPAACCGVVGLKPTYGRVSRYGLVAFGSSLDQIGPITKTVEDTAILLKSIAGHDKRDSTSSDRAVPDYAKALEAPASSVLKGKRIGLPKEYFTEHLSPEIQKRLDAVIDFYKKQGAEMVPVSLPTSEYGIGCYYIIATAEASANLARFDGIRYGRRSKNAKDLKEVYFKSRSEGFGLEVKRRILLGTYVLSSGYYDAYYLKAMKVRRVIKNDFDAVLKQVDFILTPMMPDPVFKIGEKSADPIKMYLSDIYTVSLNLAGVPGISVPCGKDSQGMPVGFQLVAGHFEEEKLLQAAHAYDKEMNAHV
ncbi:MAG: Asp-tRNA(Asn)/Glu-tRNA(Gln) amidotransferase subunit GatA, partial [Spirochaetia bacterium]|nr:Asp-tRNA(Asn)/Glu-tRNA(Gln) amidotransferase subunit GatA [Spirochaetia bacterium]